MKRMDFSLPEFFQTFSFLLFLAGSVVALIFNGIELSLWLMVFAMAASLLTAVLPALGFNWLRLEKKGCRGGWWVALVLQVISWGTFAAAMFFRVMRDPLNFKYLIGVTLFLWALWLLIFLYSRHACQPKTAGDTLSDDTVQIKIDK
ncbi:MAG: hypothetical protein H0S79_23945 [Anaerolineaceae bacterium]|nr:hypothetical protein [Anaerolineaceae bacterium]